MICSASHFYLDNKIAKYQEEEEEIQLGRKTREMKLETLMAEPLLAKKKVVGLCNQTQSFLLSKTMLGQE